MTNEIRTLTRKRPHSATLIGQASAQGSEETDQLITTDSIGGFKEGGAVAGDSINQCKRDASKSIKMVQVQIAFDAVSRKVVVKSPGKQTDVENASVVKHVEPK